MALTGTCPVCGDNVLVMETSDSLGLVRPHRDARNPSRLGGCDGAGKRAVEYKGHKGSSMAHAENEYNIRFVHSISPSKNDTDGPFLIPDNAFSDKTRLASELRALGALHKGQRISSFRVEGDKVVVFPQGGRPWHSLIIEPAENYVPHGNVVPSWARRRKRK